MLKPDFSAKTIRTEMNLSKSNLYHISKRLQLWFGSYFSKKENCICVWMWSKPNLAWQLNKANLFFGLNSTFTSQSFTFLLFFCPFCCLFIVFISLAASLLPASWMRDSSPFFYPLDSHWTLLLRSHVHHELSPLGYRSSAHESNPRVAALDCASRRGEQRGKQSAPPAPPPGRWERRRLAEFTHLAGFRWERLPPIDLPLQSSLLRATKVNSKCSALKKHGVQRLGQDKFGPSFHFFATEIPDFTQISLEFCNLATYDCNLSLTSASCSRCFFPLCSVNICTMLSNIIDV